MYSHHSPAQSNTSLSDEDDDELEKSLYFLEPAPPTRWSSNAQPHSEDYSIPLTNPKSIKYSPASRLPPEVLIHVLKQLHSPRDWHACLLVSRTWCACSVELLWHKPHFPKPSSLFQMISVLRREPQDQTFTYPRFVRRLNFLALGQDLNTQLFIRLAACKRLERLTLVGCSSITDEALATVLPSFPDLVALDLTGVVETTNRSIITLAQTARRLQGLNLGLCKLVTDDGVVAIAKSCPQLRRIKLSGLELITDVSVKTLATYCPVILEIDLNNCERITDGSVRELWTHSIHMREFRLSHCHQLTDLGFPAPIREAPPEGPDPFPNNSHAAIPQYPPLKLSRPFEHLRVLDLTACPSITDEAVEGIVMSARKIRNLVLAKCVGLTDAAVESISKLGKNLHYLHLGHASAITDRSVTKLARSCLRLRYIDLACCPLLTDLSVFELASLPKLRRIGLVRVVNLTDQAIMTLGEERRHTLERIHLSFCEQITVPAVHFLLQKLTKLTHLSLTGIPAFRHRELQQFCRAPPREFNSTQRAAFCVYSNAGVRELRRYLETIIPPVGDDGLEGYDADEDDQDGFARDYVVDPEIDEYTDGGRILRPPNVPRIVHAAQVRVSGFTHTSPSTAVNTPVQGNDDASASYTDTPSPLDWHEPEGQTPTGTVRANGHTRQNNPPVQGNPSQHLPSNSTNSARSSQSNGIGFMNSYDPVAMRREAELAALNGTATPDLVFAELGHGPGVAGPGLSTPAVRSENHLPIDEDETYPSLSTDSWVVQSDTPVASVDEFTGVNTSRRRFRRATIESLLPESAGPPPNINRELEESLHTALGELHVNDQHWDDEGRGRRTRFSGLRAAFVNIGRTNANRIHGASPSGSSRNQR
ncbi:hypothetical protein BU17DRAFT_42601 [Hysterangium stoloniferum]|nr:hypothetical protein BU17DRAFT_42601 [Hysterangium stoloniferum]